MAENIKEISKFRWINEPTVWNLANGEISVTTDDKTDFWQGPGTAKRHSGHLYGCDVTEDFTFQACVEGDFTSLYDQAGVMLLVDEKHWIKAGIEYYDGLPTIASVLTNELSDWAIGIYQGNPKKFWIRLTKVDNNVRVQYSTDGVTWPMLRLCPFPKSDSYFVGVMCCAPKREGLKVRFSDIKITKSLDKDLHDLS